ncbi:MAG: SWIM zinc finger family protein [Halobacteriota archaeon]
MTHTRHTSASPTRPVRGKTTLPAHDATGRSLRARIEPMAVRPLRDGRYVVETDGGTYVVDAEAETCTCPDFSIRNARCKHLRRVAIEIDAGEVPPPHMKAAVCAVCGERTFVSMAAEGPQLCDDHDLNPGAVVRDRETGSLLLVTGTTNRRADEVTTAEGRLVSEYPSNERYGDHEPVFEAVYLASVRPDDVELDDLKRYSFPASRLRPTEVTDHRTARHRGHHPVEMVG